MKIENTKAQMRKGVLEYCILSVLKDEDAYVAEILNTLKSAKLLVVEGTIYPLLTRLKNAGLLNYRWEESASGPPRKYYGLTQEGRVFLEELNNTWNELQNAVNIVTSKTTIMNKTVNINLAGHFFHIDENAYIKLQGYLEAIKRSFTNSEGKEEIISDIEARIAELFNERMKHVRQVVGLKEVDEVIAIMGQPEDYLVDDDIFEDGHQQNTTKNTTQKKLFRDVENSYISGVSSGLANYIGISPIIMRLLWIILAFMSLGTFLVIYILFWILIPAAITTADKIMMKGDPVNIDNIEKKNKRWF